VMHSEQEFEYHLQLFRIFQTATVSFLSTAGLVRLSFKKGGRNKIEVEL
jgi:hypothetical protein